MTPEEWPHQKKISRSSARDLPVTLPSYLPSKKQQLHIYRPLLPDRVISIILNASNSYRYIFWETSL